MNGYKTLVVVFALAMMTAPALAEFSGKQGEKATYESIMNGQNAGTAVYSVEGRFKIGNIQTRRFVIADSTGGKVEGYLDDNGKPIKVDIFDSNTSQAAMSVAFDHQKRVATIAYTAPASYLSNTTQAAKQTMNVNITSNTYDLTLLTQCLRYLPIRDGYKTSFQLFNVVSAVMMSSMAPLLTMMAGVTVDPASMAMLNVTLQVAGRESVKVGTNSYDCYKVVLNITQNVPPQLAAIDPSLASQSMEQQVWLRTNDLLLVRSYSESLSSTPQLTGTTTPQRITSETRLVSVTYA
jgi:hypothetical protein